MNPLLGFCDVSFAYGGLDRSRIELVPDLEQALDRGLSLTPTGGLGRGRSHNGWRCSG